VRTVELRPGNAKIVHHAVMMIDRTQSSRRYDARDEELGFGGMSLGDAERPGSQPIPWTPGMAPSPGIEGVAWQLDPGSDVVLQMHMLPSGKPEMIRPAIGFHFAERSPTRRTWSFTLHSEEIDIPAGESSYVVEDRVTFPAPVEVVSVYPHAHYLGKEIQGYAIRPDGTRQWLVRISDWDFNWQDEYRYRNPVQLPAGSTIVMHFIYDNSADNPRNPTIPPKRVTHGTSSLDEMGTLSFEVIPQNEEDLFLLQAAVSRHDLELDPDSWFSLNNLGIALERSGDLEGAADHFRRAVALMPSYAKAHHNLGVVLWEQGNADEAIAEYRLALRHNPFFAEAYLNLANALASRGEYRQAVDYYSKALELNEYDSRAHFNMALAMEALGRGEVALNHYREAAELAPDDAEVHNNLGSLLASVGDTKAAIGRFRRAVDLDPTSAEFAGNLGTALLLHGMIDLAIDRYRDALKLDPSLEDVAYNLEAALEIQAEADAAIRAAEGAVRADRRNDPMLLAQLAASYAGAGRFDRAIDTAREAMVRAEAVGDAELAQSIERYLDSWRAALPQ
jgi:tetratricopeptide (TPR) repeat protein